MIMTNEEIAREYRLSADPKKQIEILADRNKTTKSAIVDILRAQGETIRGNYGKKRDDVPQITMYDTSEAAAVKEAEQPERVLIMEPASGGRGAETPEAPAVSRDDILAALVKSEKKVTTLEDVLNLVLWAAAEYEGSDNPAECVTYLLGVKDAYEAINGPIIR